MFCSFLVLTDVESMYNGLCGVLSTFSNSSSSSTDSRIDSWIEAWFNENYLDMLDGKAKELEFLNIISLMSLYY